MTNEDYEQYNAKKLAEAEAKAKEYFANQKKRQTYFVFSGASAIEDDDLDKSFYFAYTQEEVDHFIQAFIDIHNQNVESETEKVDTLAGVSEDTHLWEYENCSPELDELLQRCLINNLLLVDIDPTPRYLYSMSCFYWDDREQEISKRIHFKVKLEDEEYLYLLTEQLAARNNCFPQFTFNNLVFSRPELARKISTAADSTIGFGIVYNEKPFLVIFDEVIADAEAVLGPVPVSNEIYFENEEKHVFIVTANTSGRKLVITEADWFNERNLKDIDADKVMTALEAKSYSKMLDKMKDKFHARTAFDDIKAWLDQSGIKYET